jgi:hypothetical protein
MPSYDLDKVDKNLLNDTLTMCFSVYIWTSWPGHTVVLKTKNASFHNSFLILQIRYYPRDKMHPGSSVILEYHVKVAEGWILMHTEDSSLSVWKYSCISINFLTGLMSLSNSEVPQDISVSRSAKMKKDLLDYWNSSHIWSIAETVSQLNIFTRHQGNIQCGDTGDLITWDSPSWSLETRFTKLAKKVEFDKNEVCGKAFTYFTVTIPVKPTFMVAVKICKMLGEGNVTAYFSSLEVMQAFQKAVRDIGPITHMWFALKKINETYVSYYDENPVSNIIWRPNTPSPFRRECVLCQSNGCTDRDCDFADIGYFQCIFKKLPILFLRGLCARTNLDTKYFPANRLGQFLWVGLDNTFIKYNASNSVWIAKMTNQSTWATIEASIDSLLLGTHVWTIYNDPRCFPGAFYKVKLNLSFCNNSMFNCGDGSCIALAARCDASIDCSDGADEIGCNIISLPENYNKAVASGTEKFDIIIKTEILNIFSIDENLGKIRLTLGISMEWFNPQLTFLNLKSNEDLNVLEDNEYSLIWKPILVLVNMEKKDFEDNVSPYIVIHTDYLANYSLADYNTMYSTKLYNGSSTKLRWYSAFR